MADTKTGRSYSLFMIVMLVLLTILSIGNLLVSLSSTSQSGNAKTAEPVILPRITPRIAFVTGGVDPFWDITALGARDAAARCGADLEVRTPDGGAAGQDNILRDLLTSDVTGVAISPLDAAGQTNLLNQVASAVHLVTFDSDAPQSKRLCYVGANNYLAGWQCGEVVQGLLPDGGRILISIGSLEKDNGRKRRQGLIDKLLDRDYEPARAADPANAELSGAGLTIVATILDDNDAGRAKTNMVAALGKYADIDCVVGLFGYSGPSILDALAETGQRGQVKVVAFDDHGATLAGIGAGHINATIVQDAYHFGYASVETLATLAREEGTPPLSGEILYPCFVVTKDNLESYVAKRHAQLHGGEG